MRIGRFAVHVAWPLVLALWLGLPLAASAQEAALSGKLTYQLGYAYTAGATAENAVAVRLELDKRLGLRGRVRLNLDGRVPAGEAAPSLELGEAYADVYLDAVDLRIGRQVINWGTADGFNPTNVINPRGALSPAALLTSGTLPEGTPVVAVQASYYLPAGYSLTGVGIAGFVPASGAREALGAIAEALGAPLGTGPLPVVGPSPVPDDGTQFEWAVRGDGLIGSHNVYLSYFNGWDDAPAAWLEFEQTPVGPVPARIVAAYRRVHQLGLATAGTIGGAAVWAEAAYTVPEKVEALDGPGALSSNEAYVQAVVGADYTFRSGLTVSGQVIYSGGGSLLSPYRKPGSAVEPQTYLAGIARYAPQPGLALQGVALVNAGDGGAIVLGRYTYHLTQAVSLTIGISRVFADEEAEFHALRAAADLVTAGINVSF